MNKRKYLLLLSLSKANAASGKRVVGNITAKIDRGAKPLWFDSAHVGIVMTSELTALQIWPIALTGTEDFKDSLILEIGPGWAARRESQHDHWMSTHLGPPR